MTINEKKENRNTKSSIEVFMDDLMLLVGNIGRQGTRMSLSKTAVVKHEQQGPVSARSEDLGLACGEERSIGDEQRGT